MPFRLNTKDSDFEAQFTHLLSLKREVSEEVDNIVRDIIEAVRAQGDEAVEAYTKKFDHFDFSQRPMRIAQGEIKNAYDSIDGKVRDALHLAAERITSHHQRQKPQDDRYTDAIGVELGTLWTAVEAAGLYVPGGTAAYPSSVLMNAIPARVAGVERLVMTAPSPGGIVNPMVLAAAYIAGVDEVYCIGGAQAVAALAYGTKTIASVSKIVGPGNAFVAAAKRRVFGTVGIDMIAGPSEVLIVADGSNSAEWMAADLLAQAEHDKAAQSILMTDDADFARAVEAAVEGQLKTLPRQEIAAASWQDFGATIVVEDFESALPLINRIAAEHLELAIDEPEALLKGIRNAGAIFMGRYTPEVIGDYVGGSNHVLPTARSARFSSGLSVLDFMKKTSLLKLGPDQLRAIGPAAVTIAEAEGLDAHARSVSMRFNGS